jgi:hypothetical protein
MLITSAASGSSRSAFQARPGPRLADEVQQDHHEQERAEREPVVLLRRVHGPAEELDRIDVGEAVRAAREVDVADEAES